MSYKSTKSHQFKPAYDRDFLVYQFCYLKLIEVAENIHISYYPKVVNQCVENRLLLVSTHQRTLILYYALYRQELQSNHRANDRVRVGVVGFSDRFLNSLFPAFTANHKKLNFDIVGVSDIWKLRRKGGKGSLEEKLGQKIKACVNNEELYRMKDLDAVIISTADFQQERRKAKLKKANRTPEYSVRSISILMILTVNY